MNNPKRSAVVFFSQIGSTIAGSNLIVIVRGAKQIVKGDALRLLMCSIALVGALALVIGCSGGVLHAQSASAPTGGPGGAWVQVAGDEFDGTSVDESKWYNCRIAPANYRDDTSCGIGEGFGNWFLNANREVSGGNLHLIAKRQAYTGPNGWSENYTSGIVSTGLGDPGQRYKWVPGQYIEMRGKVAAGTGFWNSFWTVPDPWVQWPNGGEVDVFEIKGGSPSCSYSHTPPNGSAVKYCLKGSQTFANSYHTWGAYWINSGSNDDCIAIYIDGTQRGNPMCGDRDELRASPQQYVIMNLRVNGGGFGGYVQSSTPFPSEMDVDYFRAFARP